MPIILELDLDIELHLEMEMDLDLGLDSGLNSEERRGPRREEKRRKEKKNRTRWDEVARKTYKERTELGPEEGEEERDMDIDTRWNRMKEVVKERMIKVEVDITKRKKRKIGYKDWWDRNCTRKKRETHRVFRKWRKSKINSEEYIEERRKWIIHLENKLIEKKVKQEELKKKCC